jgi:hypothetical protein
MGGRDDLFDGRDETLYRTAAINPARLQIWFDEPTTISGMRVSVSQELHECRLVAAPSRRELADQGGGFRVLAEHVRVVECPGDRREAVIRLTSPVTARALQLEVARLSGDNFVHIYEWQLFEGPPGLASPPLPAPVMSPARLRAPSLGSRDGTDFTNTACEYSLHLPDGWTGTQEQSPETVTVSCPDLPGVTIRIRAKKQSRPITFAEAMTS